MAPTDHAAVYEGIRVRVTDLVSGLPDAALDAGAPATPGWRVRDVVAHLAGAAADVLAGNLEGVASDPWTEAQVAARRDAPIDAVLAEWADSAARLEARMPGYEAPVRAIILTDAVTHEFDVRGALGDRGARDSDAVAYAFRGVSGGIGARRGDGGPLRIVHEAGEVVVGDGDPAATVRTTRFEVLRAALGRRSASQVAAWDWDGDPMPDTVVLPAFAPLRSTPLDE